MGADTDLSYTRQEILDYLPGGWVLADPADPGDWNSEHRCWLVSLRDIADVDWELRIDSKTAASSGRIDALKEAVDRLHRAALGSPGFFG